MAINFPVSPTVGQAFTGGAKNWAWTGSAWETVSASTSTSSSNDFILNVGVADNNTYELATEAPAGGYSLSLGFTDSTLDIYLLSVTGTLVGYTNSLAVIASESFKRIVVLGATSSQKISFIYNGTSTNSSSSGLDYSAGAYIQSASPTSMPNVNTSTTIIGGNFASDVQVVFIGSDLVNRSAKSISVISPTELLVVRPDSMPTSYSPYSIKVTNLNVQAPSGSSAHILSNVITVGSTPSWTTGQVLTSYTIGASYSLQLAVSDGTDGQVQSFSIISGNLPAGLSLNSTTGLISGISSAQGKVAFSIRATDLGGNIIEKAFELSHAPTFTTSSFAQVLKNATYSSTLVATDPTAVVPTYSLISGTLPAGLTFASNGKLSGISSAVGSSLLVVRAAVANYGYKDISITLVVRDSTSITITASTTWIAPTGVTSVNALIVAGGGSGGSTGSSYEYVTAGGGAGGLLLTDVAVTPGTGYSVIIGAGGVTNNTSNTEGSNSSFATYLAFGGGRGGTLFNGTPGGGGSGGGAARGSGVGASGTAGQGNKGGDSPADRQPGSGGGASAPGLTGNTSTPGGAGLGGYAEGGWSANSYSGPANTGNGGGGSTDRGQGGNGGSGVVKLTWAI